MGQRRRDRGEVDPRGGCENMNAQHSLPQELPNLGRADRSIEGKCILHAVWNAQGRAAPGASASALAAIGRRDTSTRKSSSFDARRRESGPAPRRARSVDHGRGQPARYRHDGIRWPRLAHRLQGGRAQPPAGEFLCLCRLRLLGISPRRARCQDRRDHALALSMRRPRSCTWPINLVSLAPDARSRSARR